MAGVSAWSVCGLIICGQFFLYMSDLSEVWRSEFVEGVVWEYGNNVVSGWFDHGVAFSTPICGDWIIWRGFWLGCWNTLFVGM